MTTTHDAAAARDFSRKTLAALARKRIFLLGPRYLPSAGGDWLNGERGYELDDNGTFKIKRHGEVRALAE